MAAILHRFIQHHFIQAGSFRGQLLYTKLSYTRAISERFSYIK